MTVDIGQDAKTLTGTISGSASRQPRGLDVQAKFDLDKLQVGTREVTELRGEIAKGAASPVVEVKDLTGKAYGGIVSGAAEIKLTSPVEYGVRLDVESVDLNDMVNAGLPAGAKPTAVAGKLSGRVQYSFRPSGKPDQQATGQLWLTKAKVGKLPVMLDLLHVLFLSLPGETAFTDGSLTYTLRGKKLVLSEIHLTGQGLSMLGSGTLNLADNTLDVTFLMGSDTLPRIYVLDDLLKGFSRELTEIHVTGTLQNPKTASVPFHSIKDVINTLLAPGKKQDEKD